MSSLRDWLTDLGITYVARSGWGARAPRYRNPLPYPPDGVVWHHTVTRGFTREISQMQGVQAFHMDARGWSDYAYGGGVGLSGAFYEGRMSEELLYGMLARTGGTGDPEDAHLLCVAALGDFHTPGADDPSLAMVRTFGAVAGWMASELGVTQQYRDRDFNLTACCGDRLAALVPFPLISPADPPPLPPTPTPDPEVPLGHRWFAALEAA